MAAVVLEFCRAIIQEQQIGLGIGFPEIGTLRLVDDTAAHHAAVHHHQIEISVEVDIGRTGAKAVVHQRGGPQA